MNKKVYVWGAGPAGLVAAWKLAEAGYQVHIYEKSDKVGGMCKSWKIQDYTIDVGPHIFHTRDQNLERIWKEDFGDLFQYGAFFSKNVKGKDFDRFYSYPLSWDGLNEFPPDLKEKVIDELERTSEAERANATNFKEYVTGLVGPTLQQLFFENYPRKLWGIPTTAMSPEWAPKRIEFRKKVSPFYDTEWNAIGKYGTGAIFERIAEKIVALGGQIHLECPVTTIDFTSEKILGFSTPNDKIQVNPDDIIISTLPIGYTSRLLGTTVDLTFRGVWCAYLGIKKGTVLPSDAHWLYFDDPRVSFTRITESSKFSKFIAPAERSLLTIETTFSLGDDIQKASPEELTQRVLIDMEKTGLIAPEDVELIHHHKEPFVYPVMKENYREQLALASSCVNRYSNLHSFGTGGDFNYSDVQVCFLKAFDLCRSLLSKSAKNTQELKSYSHALPNKVVKIEGFAIGDSYPAFIIAEAGLNHNGDINVAKRLIDEAKACGCSAVKFQLYSAGSRISSKVKGVNYAETITGLEETIYEMFDRLALSVQQQGELIEYGRQRNIITFSTPFDTDNADQLEAMGVSVFKIASMDITNLPLIRHVARKMKPIILSTGMSNLGLIEEAVDTILSEGNRDIILLQCNSAYPSDPKDYNLNVIPSFKKTFGCPVGLSDHTISLLVSNVALSIGSHVIERHFTLNRHMEGPDHILSSDPDEMAELVRNSTLIPAVLGDGRKRIQPGEYKTINQQRKSLYASRDIEAGDVIRGEDIAIKGPGGGILPRDIDIIIGRRAQSAIPKDYPITWEQV